MKKNVVIRIMLFLIAMAWGLTTIRKVQAQETLKYEILYISSYCYEWESVPQQIEGLKNVLGEDAYIKYLFMNTPYMTYQDADANLYQQFLTRKEEFSTTDVVIVGDDAALRFVMEHQSEFFTDIPIVFMGINDVKLAKEAMQLSNITGMMESYPIRETLQCAVELYPEAENVVAICDNTISAQSVLQQFQQCQEEFVQLNFVNFECNRFDTNTIKEKVSQYGKDTILLYIQCSRDRDGRHCTYQQGIELITSAANIPVFCFDELGIEKGGLGGVVVSYVRNAEDVANIALRILQGEEAENIEVTYPKTYCMYNAQTMKQYGILEKDISPNAVIAYKEIGFFEKNRKMFMRYGANLLIIMAFLGLHFYLNKMKEKKLSMAIEAAEKANEAKSDFLSRMSHDIRTPLNCIIGMSELVSKTADMEKIKDYNSKIVVSARFLMGLINDILDMSKIESGNIVLHLRAYGKPAFEQYMNAVIRPLCEQKELKFHCDMHLVEEYQPLLDELRFNQIIFNILSNSVKYTPKGGQVDFFLTETLYEEDKILMVKVDIIDTGIGMSPEFMQHMFEEFSQEERTDKDTEGMDSSGLGLAIVKSLIDIMGGTLEVKSEVDKGSQFTVEIPCRYVERKPTEEQISVPSGKEFNGKHFLVCEDKAISAKIVQIMLEEQGAEVTVTADGVEALETFKASELYDVDAILMDIRMPNMGGIEATEKIRGLQREDARSVPIIAMTADAFERDKERAKVAGMSGYLTKPIEEKALIATLCQYVD